QSVENTLAKQGVKKEEMEFSGVLKATEQGGKVPVPALQEQVLNRVDEFGTIVRDRNSTEPAYLSTVPRAGDMLNPTYREKVTTFSLGEDKSRFTSPHFYDTPNYLMHRREMDTTIGDDAEP